jgi:hypothetical protein
MICQWFIDKWDDGTRSGIVYRLFSKAAASEEARMYIPSFA